MKRHVEIAGRLAGPSLTLSFDGPGLDGRSRNYRREVLLQPALRQYQLGSAVAQHMQKTIRRIIRIERQIGSTGFQHGENTDDQFDAALQREANQPIATDAVASQLPRQAIGASVQIAIADLLVPKHQRDGRRRSCGTCLDLGDDFRGQNSMSWQCSPLQPSTFRI